MNNEITWKEPDIQRVNNFLLIKGSQLFKSGHDSDRIYRACYALPSDPKEMDDWVDKHLNETETEALYEFISNSVSLDNNS